jgi:hypothetical protein
MTPAQLVLRYFLLAELVNSLQNRLLFNPKDEIAALQCDLAKAEEAATWALIRAAGV